jgi:hypothetical protein
VGATQHAGAYHDHSPSSRIGAATIRQLVEVERFGTVPVDEVVRPTQLHQEMFRCANHQANLTRR